MKGSKEEIKAIDLRSDYKVNPIGIHNVAPRLSWRMTAYGKNRKQSAYQIQVFKKESDIKEVLVWDSEKVYSGESVNIPYKGSSLHPERGFIGKFVYGMKRKMFLNGVRRLFLKPVY